MFVCHLIPCWEQSLLFTAWELGKQGKQAWLPSQSRWVNVCPLGIWRDHFIEYDECIPCLLCYYPMQGKFGGFCLSCGPTRVLLILNAISSLIGPLKELREPRKDTDSSVLYYRRSRPTHKKQFFVDKIQQGGKLQPMSDNAADIWYSWYQTCWLTIPWEKGSIKN